MENGVDTQKQIQRVWDSTQDVFEELKENKIPRSKAW